MGRPASLQLTPDQLQAKIDAYFQHCEDGIEARNLKSGDVRVRYKERICHIGLALWLGIDRSTLDEYMDGNYPTEWIDKVSKDHPLFGMDREYIAQEYSRILACARERIILHTYTAGANGDMDQRIAAAMLAKLGVTDKITDSNGVLEIKWQGVQPEDAERFSK